MEILRIKSTSDFSLDARSEKKVWMDAKELVLVDSFSASEVNKKAKVKAAWSEKGLYLLFVVEDEHIWGTYKNNDDPIYDEEVVEVFVSKGERIPVEYYEFQFSPKGVRFDAKISNPTGDRRDAGFKADVGWNSQGLKFFQKIDSGESVGEYVAGTWTSEVFIPWADLGWDVAVGDRLRVNFFRIDGYPKQSSFQSWIPTMKNPPDFHVPERFGLIELG